ncbi:hypothetical protein K438DRAFT_1832592 [Mycena galopus ATCC 62051]|nr:hypothetical protein K438DRAFT_1832592 [Mycena galopus ATCC 62051]
MANSDPYSYYFGGRTTPTPTRRTSRGRQVLELDFVYRRKSHSILNSTVVGRDGYTPYFHIVTGSEDTLFRTNNGRTVASIEWGGKGGNSTAFVEVRNGVMKQRYRMMIAYGERYVWVPQSDSICMYHWNPTAVGSVPLLLARIEKEDQTVTLEITVEAINRGLLEMAVVAATLFQSGCTID